MIPNYDLIIIGAGPAGLSAAIYAARYNLKTLVVGEVVGGQMTEVLLIENYPGVPNVSGIELGQKMLKQAQGVGSKFLGEAIETVRKVDGGFEVTTATKKAFTARVLLLTSGTEPKRLDIPGEKELRGHGVSYCVTCDGPLFRGKTVAVVGGVDAAVTGALELAGYATKVYLIHHRETFRAKPAFVDQVKHNPKIALITPTSLTALAGATKLEKLILDQPYQGSLELAVDGLFVEIGSRPSTRLTNQLELTKDEFNFVKVGLDQSTSEPGVFAAGDITTGSNRVRQIVTATAEGAIAAKSIYYCLQALTPHISPTNLKINPTKCVGCGICVNQAPNTFELGPDGFAHVKTPTNDNPKTIRQAVDSCPEGAIKIFLKI